MPVFLLPYPVVTELFWPPDRVAGLQFGGGMGYYRSPGMIVGCFLLFFVSACAQTVHHSITTLERRPDNPRILVMPVDVEIYEISVGGALELKAEWTERSRNNLEQVIESALRKNAAVPVTYIPETKASQDHLQFLKLHGSVGRAIILNHYTPGFALPTKDSFEWTLGSVFESFQTDVNSDYALFVFMRDHHSSPGRVITGVLTALLFGYVPGTGLQTGFASLVDIKSGEIVWFNRLVKASFGDVRDSTKAQTAIEVLLSEFPK
ncbi:MAG: hypothetical protein QGF13_01635 [Alphaproteobacteria bacterium]|nr:hypothetical protein [Alphaproteobacteria bacterium]